MKRIILAMVIIVTVLTPRVVLAHHSPNDYPAVWANQPKDVMADSWYMYNRECTSYAAWKVWETFHYSVYNWGDARFWVEDAVSRKIPFGYLPQVHSVAVDPSRSPGHVMWVEKLNRDGTIHISQYNADGQGNFSTADIQTTGLYFVYFRSGMVSETFSK